MPEYSPLCDTDLRAYLAYLAINAVGSGDGPNVERLIGECRRRGVGEGVGCCDGDGSAVVGVFDGFCKAARMGVGGIGSGSVGGGVGNIDCYVGGGSGRGEGHNAWVANRDVGRAICGLDSCVGSEVGGSAADGCDDERGKAQSGISASTTSGKSGVVSDALVGRARRKAKRALRNTAVGVAAGEEKVEKKKMSGAAQRKARKEKASLGKETVKESSELQDEVNTGVASSNWRVRAPRAPVHVGYFSTVPKTVQDKLKETRANLLIAENQAKIRKLEVENKMDVLARTAELKRLQMDKQLKAEYEHKYGDGTSGFAETVISAGLQDTIIVPSVSTGTGSVSPDSSISVAEVRKMEKLIERLTQENVELGVKVAALAAAVESKGDGTSADRDPGDVVGASRVTLLQAHREFYEGLDEAYEQLDAQDRKPPSLFSEDEYLRRLDAGGKKTEGYVFGKGGPSIVGY